MTDTPNLTAALVAFQASLPAIPRTQQAQYGKYADLADVSGQILPRLAAVGLCYLSHLHCETNDSGELTRIYLRCELRHTNGDFVFADWPILPAGPQVMGGAITYARRYCLLALTGCQPAGEDDDGANVPEPPPSKPAKKTTPPKTVDPLAPIGAPMFTPKVSVTSSDAQRKMMWAMLRSLGFDNSHESADQARRLLSAVAGRHLESSTDLTGKEAATVIDTLKALQDSPDATEAIRILIDGAAL